MDFPKISPARWVCCLLAVVYVWTLPLLATYGFAEKGADSISNFIANAHATGAMAVCSFAPLQLLVEYQDMVIENLQHTYPRWIKITQRMFLFFYGMFLICTSTYVPVLHTISVACFGISFILHSITILKKVQPSKICTLILMVGIIAFASLPFVPGMWFWALECVGFTAMVIFTPCEISIAAAEYEDRMKTPVSRLLASNIINTHHIT